MDVLKEIHDWAVGFFSLDDVIKIIKSGDYRTLLTFKGFTSVVGPLFPIVLVLEILVGLISRKFKAVNYKVPFFSYMLNLVVGKFISIAAIVFCIGLFEKYAIIKIGFTWYWFIYGYIVWELGHFFYHYFGHKVRLFWCLHSTHHAPQTMNLSVSYAHFFLEGPYADVIRTTTCILLGVPPLMLVAIMFIDGFWGGFIHIGEGMVKDSRLGPLENVILTPSHHRVHHGRNPIYMDTNFCNLLPIWDRVFRTYQPERRDIPVEYGITRKMIPNSFMDAYFGEFILLAKDVARAPGIKNKLLYIIMPPGWSHTGEHKTAHKVRKEFLEKMEPGTRKIGKNELLVEHQA